jgi:CheY-like chemotaxis protein
VGTLPVEAAKATLADCTLSGHVLLAEDGPDNQRLIAFLLRRAGAVVDLADNGRIALEMIEAASVEGRQYDLILTDMEMPELDGYTLAATLRNRGCTTPIVALTAHAMVMDRQRCLAAGCDDYIAKPIDKLNLQRRCAQWLAKQSAPVVTAAAPCGDSLELVLG